MGRAGCELQLRGGCVAVLLTLGALLAGCSSDPASPASPASSSWFPSLSGSFPGFTSSPAPTQAAVPGGPPLPSVEDDCPTVQIRGGASTLAVAAKADQPTAQDLRYQLTFTQTARQCAIVGASLRMRVGVQGRVIAGPAGVPSQVDVPVRYAVVREGVTPNTITTKFRRFPVAVAPGATNVVFTDIEEDLSFPIPSPAELEAYVVYVGFDDFGDRDERRPPAAKKAAPRAK